MLSNVQNTLESLTQALKEKSTTPRLDAELLLAKIIEKPRAWLYAHNEAILNPKQKSLLENFLTRRLLGEPIAYLLEEKEFWSLSLKVNSAVLVPRPETEHMVEWVLEHFLPENVLSVLDLGTGSGALSLAIASEFPNWSIDAVDVSPEALKIAEENAYAHHLKNIKFYLSDWYGALPAKKYALILSNPPYIPANDPHLTELTHEPLLALQSGNSGLAAIQTIIKQAPAFLQAGGYLAIEHGYNQGKTVQELFSQYGFIDITLHTDLAHLPRFTTARYLC